MSEYQYYEFLATDRTLSPREISEIRNISSRAEISATRFRNVYNFGDFHGDVSDFLTRYFDLHIYVANWGTHTFGIGLPAASCPLDPLKPYFPKDSPSSITRQSDRIVILMESSSEADGWDDQGDEWMPALAPLREEILAGDLRPLYLAWLAAIEDENSALDDDAPEPPVPPGLRKLTKPQQQLAAFLRIRDELFTIAAELSPPLVSGTPDLAAFIRNLPAAEKDARLIEFLEGRGAHAARELRSGLMRSIPAAVPARTARTAGDLRRAADAVAELRQQLEAGAEARRRAQAAAQAAVARARHLDELAPRRHQLWQQVQHLIATRIPKNYDQAVSHLRDLHDLAQRADHVAEYEEKFATLRQEHSGKPTLLARLRKAGLV